MESLKPENGEKGRQTNGEWLVKTLKPAGCALVLIFAVIMVVMCLSIGRDPIKGYAPPQTQEYYAAHLNELKTELEAKVFPHVEGVSSCEEEDGRLKIEIEYDSFVVTRSALLRYYDEELFELVQLDK